MTKRALSIDFVLAFAVVGIVFLLVIPLPPIILDLFLCLNLALSLMTLLLTLYVNRALEFSSFPALLLFLTLFRLGLNIASTRMILTLGKGGAIIATFGEFVTAGNIAVGLIIFLLLTAINFFVITNGAGRVAEVAARFTLEALPGKQMAIDSDLQSGSLSHIEAQKLRFECAQESSFYGAMDGASKFVKGDAIAGLLITGINLIGGFAFGLILKGLSFLDCIKIFTRLTVGDGLVSQIPALLVSVAAGIMVTRASHESVARSLSTQIFRHPKVLVFTAVFLVLLGCVPGMPTLVLFPMAAMIGGYGGFLFRLNNTQDLNENFEGSFVVKIDSSQAHLIQALYLEIPNCRAVIEKKMGIALPQVQVCALSEAKTFIQIYYNQALLFEGGNLDLQQVLEKLEELIYAKLASLVTREKISQKVEQVRHYNRAVVNELIPQKIKLGDLVLICQQLLKEEVPIRDFEALLEAVANEISKAGGRFVSARVVEAVRVALQPDITDHFFRERSVIQVIGIDPRVEQLIAAGVKGESIQLRPQTLNKIHDRLDKLLSKHSLEKDLLVITSQEARSSLRTLVEKRFPRLKVLSHEEVKEGIEIKQMGLIDREVI